jgi:hypothetical protein
LTEVVAMSSVDVSNELEMTGNRWESGEGRVREEHLERDGRKSGIGSRAPVYNTPIDGIAKVLGDVLEAVVMQGGRFDSEFGKSSDSIANVGACCDVCKQQFTEKGAIRESHVGFEFGVFRCRLSRANGVVEGVDVRGFEWLRRT